MPANDTAAPASPAAKSSRIAGPDAGVRAVIAEFGRLLAVFSNELAESFEEADRECTAVGESFHEIAAAKCRIQAAVGADSAQALVHEECRRIDRGLAGAVGALQYHDRLAQHVAQIRSGLGSLQLLLRHQAEHSDADWLKSLENVERTYRLEWKRLARVAAPESGGDAESGAAAGASVELF